MKAVVRPGRIAAERREPLDDQKIRLAATVGIPCPAIANAIYDAVGVRLRHTPFTPERVLAALKKKAG
jgi:hypothetical protein